jgi:CO/xanthine dehydrogenase Mo-binding subunit
MAPTDRREFLRDAALLSGGLVFAFRLPSASRRSPAAAAEDTFKPNAFLRIAKDGSITIVAKHEEMGQGIHTTLALLVCEELGASPEQVKVVFAPVDAAYAHTAFGMQITGGSSSTWSAYEQMRTAGASARAMLVAAAAARLGVAEGDLVTEAAVVKTKDGGRASHSRTSSTTRASSRRRRPSSSRIRSSSRSSASRSTASTRPRRSGARPFSASTPTCRARRSRSSRAARGSAASS